MACRTLAPAFLVVFGLGAAVSAEETRDQVLLIGDSHSAKGRTLGLRLPPKLTGPKWVVDVYAVGGASSNWYTPGARVSGNANSRSTLNTGGITGVAKLSELTTARTKVVVIALGTNHIDWARLKSAGTATFYHLDASRRLAAEAGANGRRCFWLGPPDMTGLRGTDPAKARAAIADYDARLAAAVGGSCAYVKLSDKTSYSGGDGIHYGDYEAVAEGAVRSIVLH